MKIGRTPRELLLSTSTAEIVEMMAFERLEPFGGLHDEFMAGQLCAVIANVERNPEHVPEPFRAEDFMPALRAALEDRMVGMQVDAPVRGENLSADELSALLDAELFGHAVH